MEMENEKNRLIEILRQANAEKDALINSQNSELVFLSNQLKTRDEMLNKISDIVDNTTVVPLGKNKHSEWEYDTWWSRIITKDEKGSQVVIIDAIDRKMGRFIVKKANEFIRLRNKKVGVL